MGVNNNISTRQCAHCGDTCPPQANTEAELAFCCTGCQTVYQILHENGLEDFYRIDANAGNSQRSLRNEDYAWLDVAELADLFVQYADENQMRVSLELPQIHCTSCVWLLENLYRLHPGVQAVSVNFAERRADILFTTQNISFRELAELLARIGYPPHFRTKQADPPANNRRLLYQIGLAGFTFGNIMLFSFPEYLGLHLDLEGRFFARLFGYFNLLLSIPVLIFSGGDYLRSAYTGLRTRLLTIDLPISIGLLALFGRSAFEVLSQTGAGYFDSLAGLLFFLLLGKWFQKYTYRQLSFDRDYRSYFPVAANRISKAGTIAAVALSSVEPGDRLLVRPGELISADGWLKTTTAAIDYSFVTGEEEPQLRTTGERVFAGGRATDSPLELLVDKRVDQSYLLQLWQDNGTDKSAASQNLTDRASRYFTGVVLFIASATFLYWAAQDFNRAINATTAVLIIACPCALALAIPFTYGALVRLLGKKGLYLRSVSVIEKLQSIDEFVLDKTGTLTQAKHEQQVCIFNQLNSLEKEVVLGMVQQSNHPKSQALTKLLLSQGIVPVSVAGVVETPGKGLAATHKGKQYRLGRPDFCNADQSHLPSAGLCIAVAGEVKAAYSSGGPGLRPGVAVMLPMLSAQGRLHLLSGDHDGSRAYWETDIDASRVNFQQSPFDKLHYIEKLQAAGKKVLMLGDGLNDAGALRAAEVGLAISDDVTAFSPACDGILAGEALTDLPRLLSFVKRGKRILFLAYGLAICYNLIGLSFAVQGLLSPVIAAILMPLSSISVVLVGVLGVRLLYGLGWK